MPTLKTPEQAERELLSACLTYEEAIDPAIESVMPEDFTNQDHRDIFAAMIDLKKRGMVLALTTVADELKRLGKEKAMYEVPKLVGLCPTAILVPYLVGTVRRNAIRRKATAALQAGITELADDPDDVDGWLGDFGSRLTGISASRPGLEALPTMQELTTAALARIERIVDGDVFPGIATGIPLLDAVLGGGFGPGQVAVLAARPGVGKSTLAEQVLIHAAKSGMSAALFSLEMARNEIMTRLYAKESGVPLDRFKPRGFVGDDWRKVTHASEQLRCLPLTIDDRTATINAICSRARRIHRERGLDIIGIDYVQLIEGHRARGDNREREIASISRAIKLLAGELVVPVLALSQVNRQPEDRTDGRIRLADLRESGSLEQDADIVLALSCPFLSDHNRYDRQYVRLEVLKNRNGISGKIIELEFLASIMTFTPWTGAKGGMIEGAAAEPRRASGKGR